MNQDLIPLVFFGIGFLVFIIGCLIFAFSATNKLTRVIIILIFLIISIVIIFTGPDVYNFFKHGGFNGLG